MKLKHIAMLCLVLVLACAAMAPPAPHGASVAPSIWQTVPFPSGVGSAPLETRYFAYDGSNNLIYVGVAISRSTLASSQAVWAIESLTYANGSLSMVQWATCGTTCVWDNRASLTYK